MTAYLQSFGDATINYFQTATKSYPPKCSLDVGHLSGAASLFIGMTLTGAYATDYFFRFISRGTVTTLQAWVIISLAPYLKKAAMITTAVSLLAYTTHMVSRGKI